MKVILEVGFRAMDCSQSNRLNCSASGKILDQLVGWSRGKDAAPMQPPSSVSHINCRPGEMSNRTPPAPARQPAGSRGVTWSFVYFEEQNYCFCYLFLLGTDSQQAHLTAHPCTCFTLNFLVQEGSVNNNSSIMIVVFAFQAKNFISSSFRHFQTGSL